MRSLLHAEGYRYRLHGKGLPGRPDLVFQKRRKIVFVHGCFWHQHAKAECTDGHRPKSNAGYWEAKLRKNVDRDAAHLETLSLQGWHVEVVWACETRNLTELRSRLVRFLGPARLAKATGNALVVPDRYSTKIHRVDVGCGAIS